MCGICGIGFTDHQRPERADLEPMNDLLRHRGPDSDGYYQAPGIGLAMRRLAIIDLATGDQPISNEDETIWLMMNGEIYNYPDLRKSLEKRGHIFRTNADTETLPHLYEEYGSELVHHLRGMFAFALWDVKASRLLIGRDRFGKKPVYYTIQEGKLYFSSELRSLAAGVPTPPEINPEAIDLYLSLQYIPDPMTAYKDVFKLPPGHILTWQQGQLEVKRYWALEFEPKLKVGRDEAEEMLREKLREAVRIRLLSDVPLGAHLSGGIDSSIVVALMAEMSSGPVKTFSVGFEEEAFSELEYARAVAERYSTEHTEFILQYGDIPATIEKLAKHFGEPFADPSALPLYLLSVVTREHVTVALNGDGGDDLFAGYMRYWLDPWANRYLRLPGLITDKLVPGFTRLLPDRADKPVGHSIPNGLHRLGQLAEIDRRASILRWGSYFSPAQRKGLWRSELLEDRQMTNAQSLLVGKFEELASGGILDRTLYTDIETYLPGDLLVKADRMTMAASLEGRSPLLDHEWAELVARLPEKWKLNGRQGKYLLKRAFGDLLPKSVLAHRKQGFGIPVGAWFRGPLVKWTQERLLSEGNPSSELFRMEAVQRLLDEHTSGRADHGKRIWALVMLNVWLQDQSSPN